MGTLLVLLICLTQLSGYCYKFQIYGQNRIHLGSRHSKIYLVLSIYSDLSTRMLFNSDQENVVTRVELLLPKHNAVKPA